MSKICTGYTLYAGMGEDKQTYLIDMDGKLIHSWPINGMPVKLLSNGNLIGSRKERGGKDPLVQEPRPEDPKDFIPWHDNIELVELDWDGNEVWSFSDYDDDNTGIIMSRQHHDFQRQGNPVGYWAPGQDNIENGTTLIMAHLNKHVPEISDKRLVDDVLYEVDSSGKLTGYEWHCADHFDEFGFNEAQKQELFEAPNYDSEKDRTDWAHLNSASILGENRHFEMGDHRFNPKNIIISARNINTVAIVDRATGSIVWKAGPHFTDDYPESRMGQIVGQHHAHMIPERLPGAGNILLFDNGGMAAHRGDNPSEFTKYRGYSRVLEVDPLTYDIVWQYEDRLEPENFYSHFLSSAQRLPNGNTLITAGAYGHFFEVTPRKEIAWEFRNPKGKGHEARTYRALRVPPEWLPENPCGYENWSELYS